MFELIYGGDDAYSPGIWSQKPIMMKMPTMMVMILIMLTVIDNHDHDQ